MKSPHLRHRTLLLTALIVALTASSVWAQGPKPYQGRDRALLIGIENYDNAPDLQYIHNDVFALRRAIGERFAGNAFNVGELKSIVDGKNFITPKGAFLQATIASFLSDAKPEDRLLLYFSGHGFRSQDGQLYLAGVDFDIKDPEKTGVSMQWLRGKLAASKAGSTLLVLDACHAGTEQESVAAAELGEPLRETPNVITLASSTGEQPSQLWKEKEQSLFTYWLCQALKGHADADGNAMIDVDELYKYVHANVTRTAKRRLGREQTPVRIVRTGTQGVPNVLTLKPRSLDEIIDDVAQELAWSAEENEMNRMAVFEFTEDTALGKVLGAKYGVLGRYCATRLQERLLELGAGNFRVADQDRVQSALKEQEFSVDDLGSEDALQKLSDKVGGLAAVSLGTFQNRVGRDLGLRCRLVGLKTGDVVSMAGGRAKLNESEWAMLGGSGYVSDERRRQRQSSASYSSDTERQDAEVREFDEQTVHPLRDPRFPFRVRVMVNGKERVGVFQRNESTGKEDYVVSFSRGEVYQLWVYNTTGKQACLRLMVDGLNTLPQKYVEKGIATYEVAPRVNLKDARHWVLDPGKGSRKQTVWGINGFVTETGAQGQLRQFKIVDAVDSIAARKNFTDQVGLITAAFYHAYDPSQSMIAGTFNGQAGTGFGNTESARLNEVKSVVATDLWGVVNIRYVLQD